MLNYRSVPKIAILLVAFGVSLLAADPTAIPLADGTLLVDGDFVQFDQDLNHYSPTLTYTIINKTSVWWNSIKLRFDIGGLCSGEPRQWSIPVDNGLLGFSKDFPVTDKGRKVDMSLWGKVDGCRTEIVKPVLLVAESDTVHINNTPPAPVDLTPQLLVIKVQRDAEAAVEAERQKKLAAARQRRQVEERKKQADQNARDAKMKAEEDAKAAEERERIRGSCGLIFRQNCGQEGQ